MTRLAVPAALPTLRDRLRQETGPAHEALDRSLELVERPVNLRQLTRLLGRFKGFHQAVEPLLGAVLEPSLMAGRSKLPALRHDLQLCAALGSLGERQADLPDLPPLTGRAEALGALYVVEGSTLGGRVIARHLRQQAAIPRVDFTYLEIYGSRTGEMWRIVCTELEAVEDPAAAARTIQTAVKMFDTLRSWLDPSNWRIDRELLSSQADGGSDRI